MKFQIFQFINGICNIQDLTLSVSVLIAYVLIYDLVTTYNQFYNQTLWELW